MKNEGGDGKTEEQGQVLILQDQTQKLKFSSQSSARHLVPSQLDFNAANQDNGILCSAVDRGNDC